MNKSNVFADSHLCEDHHQIKIRWFQSCSTDSEQLPSNSQLGSVSVFSGLTPHFHFNDSQRGRNPLKEPGAQRIWTGRAGLNSSWRSTDTEDEDVSGLKRTWQELPRADVSTGAADQTDPGKQTLACENDAGTPFMKRRTRVGMSPVQYPVSVSIWYWAKPLDGKLDKEKSVNTKYQTRFTRNRWQAAKTNMYQRRHVTSMRVWANNAWFELPRSKGEEGLSHKHTRSHRGRRWDV